MRPPRAAGEPQVPVGGLANALLGALQRSPGSIWFGWNGRTALPGRENRLSRRAVQGVELFGVPLTQAELDCYYLGFCNQALWPLLHCFQGKVKLDLDQAACYRTVQRRFAEALRPLLRPGDLVWVHDYHLLLLGRELRQLGWTGRIGFFLHTPFPPRELWQLLPEPAETLEAMLEYDLAGFHVQGFLDNYVYCCQRELKALWDGSTLTARGLIQKVGVYPVGIEPKDFLPRDEPPLPPGKLRAPLGRAVRDHRLILGVDRLDYTKGIPERILAFEDFIRRFTVWRKQVVFAQIASPSRSEVFEYAEQKREVETLIGRVNGEMSETDWVPIRYLYRSYSREFLARLYRAADVGLVTPLRDGMNLVAKEFVAAQEPESPGVLILSRCAGAAEELREALVVNPFVHSEVADAIERALSMPVAERQERHTALLDRVCSATSTDWGRNFIRDLGERVANEVLLAAESGLTVEASADGD
jgi:trehalose 6-phosphate synthase